MRVGRLHKSMAFMVRPVCPLACDIVVYDCVVRVQCMCVVQELRLCFSYM